MFKKLLRSKNASTINEDDKVYEPEIVESGEHNSLDLYKGRSRDSSRNVVNLEDHRVTHHHHHNNLRETHHHHHSTELRTTGGGLSQIADQIMSTLAIVFFIIIGFSICGA